MQKKILILVAILLTPRMQNAFNLTGIQMKTSPGATVTGLTGIQQNYPQGIQADKKPMIEPGVCTIGNTVECKNDGKSIGMFDVSIAGDWFGWETKSPSPTIKVGSSIKVVNNADPKKAIYLGYQSSNRQSQVVRGPVSLSCYLCNGSSAQDPNQRANPCPNPLDANYCVTCSPEQIPCNKVLSLQRAQAKGAEDRAQDANSIITRLGLTGTLIPVVNK